MTADGYEPRDPLAAVQAGGPGGIEGIAGVSLYASTDRWEALRAFYVDQVGLVPDGPDKPHRVAFTWGTGPARVRIILGKHDGVSGANTDPSRVMVNLLTHNLREVAAGMAERGVEFILEPTEMRWGGWMATFRDPDGNTMQLLQPGDGEQE